MKSYKQIMNRVGDPVDPNTIYGPMHSQVGVTNYLNTIQEATKLGGKIEFGGKVIIYQFELCIRLLLAITKFCLFL